MSFDIYGNNLRRGHCEVHPHIHEEYPCSQCIGESNQREYERAMNDQYAASMEPERDTSGLVVSESVVRGLVEALEIALAKLESNECFHEDTYRGGAIWTICHICGQKWADDEGGFKPYQEPAHFAQIRDALAAYRGSSK